MGFICLITAKSLTTFFRTQVLKRKKELKFNKICKSKVIQIKKYIPSKTTGLSKLNFQNRTSLKSKTVAAQNSRIDYLWDCAVFFWQYDRPNWLNYMTNISRDTYSGKCTITFLQIFDLSPTDPIFIYTTLEFAINQAKSLNISKLVLTFVQTLWLKVKEIWNCKSINTVLILQSFHLMMSLMFSSISSLMKRSGLSDALSTCNGVYAIENMMSGKAITQTDEWVTGHFEYKLTSEQTSLFKGEYIRKPAKLLLRNYILKKLKEI